MGYIYQQDQNGHMKVCCTANASSAGASNNKKYGGEIGILKEDDGHPSNLGIHDFTYFME